MSDNDLKNFKEVAFFELDGPVWDVKWNSSGTMLAASYVGNDSKNSLAIYKEIVRGNWTLVDTIKIG